MKPFTLSILFLLLMSMAKSQSLSITRHADEAMPIESTAGLSQALCTNHGKSSGLEFQNRFSNASHQPTNWKGVRRTGGYLMLTGVGLTVLGSVTLASYHPDDSSGYGYFAVGVVTSVGGVLTFFTGTLVTIIGALGSASDRHRYGFQLKSKKDGVSLVYHF